MRGVRGALTREEVGDGEDAERPPHGAQLGLLDQIVHALHPLPHLGPRAAGARPEGGGGGLTQQGPSWVADPPQGSAAAGAVAGEEGRRAWQRGGEVSRRRFFFLFLSLSLSLFLDFL